MTSLAHAMAFRQSVRQARALGGDYLGLHVYSASEYADMSLWLGPDSLGGCAVTREGDLVSTFRHPDGRSIAGLLREASEEAITLDCFDTDGFLPELYRGYGFIPVSRVAWSDALAPDGWDPLVNGRPNVVLMLHQQALRPGLHPTPYASHPKGYLFAPLCLAWENAELIRQGYRR